MEKVCISTLAVESVLALRQDRMNCFHGPHECGDFHFFLVRVVSRTCLPFTSSFGRA
jgi:hypothetical protein